MVEVHGQPEKAMSDGPQSLDFAGFESLMKEIKAVASALQRDALFRPEKVRGTL
jgi:3-deoxy-7-phosphoheptulonate synthase